MKLRSLAVVLATLSALSDSGAQSPQPVTTPGVAAEPRVVPVPSPVTATRAPQPAPWQRIDPDPAKRQYYVYRRFAPPDFAARLDQPVTNSAFRELLAMRAASFRSGSTSLSLAINPDAIVDVGATRPEDANTVALVDLEKSPDLRAMVRTALKVDERTNYVVPFLSSTFAREAGATPAYRSHDSLIVSVAAKDHSRVAVWRFSDGRWQRVSEVVAGAVSTRDPQTLLNKLQMPRNRVYYEGFTKIVRAGAAVQKPLVHPASIEQIGALTSGVASKDTSPDPGKAAESQTPAEPATYTAYGKTALCSRYCSASSCVGCCSTVRRGTELHVGAIAFACHALSDLCPWCHFGCAANTAALLGVAMTQYVGCVGSCSQPWEIPANQGNPRNCPVH